MGKFDGILLGTDLDGTLLCADKTVSEENKKAIEYFKSEGGFFTFFTGRLPVGAKPVLEQVMPNAPYGCMNGAGICDPATGKIIWSLTLADGVVDILEYVDKKHPDIGFEISTDKIYFCKKNKEIIKHMTDESLPDLPCDYKTFDQSIGKILFGVPNEKMLGFIADVCSHPKAYLFDFIRSDKIYFEILPKGSNKGNLLLKIAEMLGIDRKNTVAVGDNDNDVSMLEAAGAGIAVSNAAESAKKAADYMTVSNEEHAIAHIIDDIECGKIRF